ncbi:hypothetical protein ZWY2020_008353 [Hordeum vulgare]|nr:hypothetical protein ZWY2020_008353 [Hordeum vulgare]
MLLLACVVCPPPRSDVVECRC